MCFYFYTCIYFIMFSILFFVSLRSLKILEMAYTKALQFLFYAMDVTQLVYQGCSQGRVPGVL